MAMFQQLTEYYQRRNSYLNQELKEITEEEFDEMLGIMPPMGHMVFDGIETFCISEMTIDTVTAQYCHDRKTNKYYMKYVNIRDKTTFITHKTLEGT